VQSCAHQDRHPNLDIVRLVPIREAEGASGAKHVQGVRKPLQLSLFDHEADSEGNKEFECFGEAEGCRGQRNNGGAHEEGPRVNGR